MSIKQQPIPFRYEPHKGDSYEEGIEGDRYLIVGRSHHCLPGRKKNGYKCNFDFSDCLKLHEFDCPPFQKKCPLFNDCTSKKKSKYCEKRIRLSCETKYCIYDHVNDSNTIVPHIFQCFYDFGNKLKELDLLKEDVTRSLWNKVGFCNYIQKITTDSNNTPTSILKEDLEDDYIKMFKSSFEFFDPLPNVIVVLYYKDIKDKIARILSDFKNAKNENFKEIKELSEENKYYVFANKRSKLYNKFNLSLLKNYDSFVNDNKNNYTKCVLVTAVAYHFTDGDRDNELIRNIVDAFIKEHKSYSEGLKSDSVYKSFTRLDGYISRGNAKNGGVLKCYHALKKYMENK